MTGSSLKWRTLSRWGGCQPSSTALRCANVVLLAPQEGEAGISMQTVTRSLADHSGEWRRRSRYRVAPQRRTSIGAVAHIAELRAVGLPHLSVTAADETGPTINGGGVLVGESRNDHVALLCPLRPRPPWPSRISVQPSSVRSRSFWRSFGVCLSRLCGRVDQAARLARVSKMSNRYLRKLLVVGAHAVPFNRKRCSDALRSWRSNDGDQTLQVSSRDS